LNDPPLENDDWFEAQIESGSSITTTVVLAIALLLLIVAFIWFMIRLDPLLSDFIERDTPVPTATSPTDGD
jgi:type VI protein secretion system component VasF